MPTSTYIPLATTTLASDTSSVTFSSIPSGYRDLVVVANTIAASSTTLQCTFNADSGANYSYVRMAGITSPQSISSSGDTSLTIGRNEADGAANVIQIQDYSATDKHKTVLGRGNDPGVIVQAIAGRWASTAAINEISFTVSGATTTFKTGSTFSLYGIEA